MSHGLHASPAQGAGVEGAGSAGDALDALRENDDFMMAFCKVIPCSKSFPHDWARCPFAHPTEGARRRDPRVHPHTGVACPRLKKEGRCNMGDSCPYAHSIFEYWLHPSRYRTQMCRDGHACKRPLCFFSHSIEQLRLPSDKPCTPSSAALAAAAAAVAANAGVHIDLPVQWPAAAAASQTLPLGQPSVPQQLPADSLPFGQAGLQRSLAGGSGGYVQQAGQQPAASAPLMGHQTMRGPFDGASGMPALQQPQAREQGNAEVVQLVLRLMERGEMSAEKSAAVLRQLLPPAVLSQLQLPPTSASADWDTSGFSEALASLSPSVLVSAVPAPAHGLGGALDGAAGPLWSPVLLGPHPGLVPGGMPAQPVNLTHAPLPAAQLAPTSQGLPAAAASRMLSAGRHAAAAPAAEASAALFNAASSSSSGGLSYASAQTGVHTLAVGGSSSSSPVQSGSPQLLSLAAPQFLAAAAEQRHAHAAARREQAAPQRPSGVSSAPGAPSPYAY